VQHEQNQYLIVFVTRVLTVGLNDFRRLAELPCNRIV